jgi:hypothetical protein
MKITPRALAASIAAFAFAVPAWAGFPYGTASPIGVPTDNVTVSLILDHTAALYTGNLYFLGWGTEDIVTNPAPNTDGTNQGTFIFSNHGTPIGTEVPLAGVFQAGQVLHFAYDIVAPVGALTDVLRTDIPADQIQFAWDPENSFFAVEDIRPEDGSDLDYNDIVVGVCFTPIPGPASLAIFGLAGLLGGRRRRR